MKQRLAMRLYRCMQHKMIVFGIFFLLALFGLQVANCLLLHLLGVPGDAYLWSFIEVLSDGFILPVLLAFSLVFCPLLGTLFWLLGGFKRAIAQYLLLFWVLFIVFGWLGLLVFVTWDQLTLLPYPWLVSVLLLRLPKHSLAFQHLLVSLMGSYSLALGALLLTRLSAKKSAEKVFGKARFANAIAINRAGLYGKQGIVLGCAHGQTLRLPGFESVLVVAPTGSGKTAAIAVPNLLEWTDSGVFNDLKGELYQLTAEHRKKVLHNECFLWSPTDIHKQSACYNPFFYVTPDPELRIRDLQLIAEILIPAAKWGEGFWYQSSREIFLTLSLYLFETKGLATLSELHDLSKQADFFQWLYDAVNENEDNFSKCLRQNAFAILGCDGKTQRTILKDFHSRMGLFNDPIVNYSTSKNDFDFREMRRKKISLYLHIPDADQERLSPLLTLFWAQLINVLGSSEPGSDEPYGVLALIDEFAHMARINKLKQGMSFLRSYHVRCIIIVQYLAQITSVYGRDDAKGFFNSKVKIAFALNDMEDAQFFSKALGTKTVKVSASSVHTGHGDTPGSRGENISYRSRALLSHDELMQLSAKKAVILMEAKSPIKADKTYWFEVPRYRQWLAASKSRVDAGEFP